MDNIDSQFQYDVTFSFAGAQRDYVEKVKESLKNYCISVFYDNDNNIDLWGKISIDIWMICILKRHAIV